MKLELFPYFKLLKIRKLDGQSLALAIVMNMELAHKLIQKKAASLYLKAIELGDSTAMNNLALSYQEGKGIPSDLEKSLELYLKAIDLDDGFAISNLGNCYFYGNSFPKKLNEAVKLFQKGASLGHSLSYYFLGLCYKKGKGVEKDFKKAIEMFEIAAHFGDPYSCYCLASCYEEGKGVEKDLKKAIQLYFMSGELGYSCAIKTLQEMFVDLLESSSTLESFSLFHFASELGSISSFHPLFVCYSQGIGVKRNVSVSIHYLHESAKQSIQESCFTYALFHYFGIFVEKNLKTAIEYLQKITMMELKETFWLGVCLFEDHNSQQNYNYGYSLIIEYRNNYERYFDFANMYLSALERKKQRYF